ncbi:MAG TPA: hypothetical protein PLR25_28500 [Planctomycetaceae bacterium]|nr:hypothetical protein [Planctomycetaceae bacterium]
MPPQLVRWLFRAVLMVVAALVLPGVCDAQESLTLNWFRSDVQEENASAWYRWAAGPVVANADSAQLVIVTDGHCSLYVNGQRVLKNVAMKRSGDNVLALGFDIKSLLRQGRNTVAVEVHTSGKTTLFGISVTAISGETKKNIGGGWRVAPIVPPVGWQQTDFNDRDWPEAKPVADAPGDRFTVTPPENFTAPVIAAKARTAPFQFEDGDHVVFVGATFFERAELSEHLEATLAGACGEKHVSFRNLGWSADTAYADSRGIFDAPDVGYLRMVEHIRAEEPTMAFVCYGQNEALTSGVTPEQYSQQLGRLLDELAASGIACVLVSPHELFPTSPPIPSPSRFNPRIRIFSEATSSVAQSRDLLFVDLFTDFSKRMLEIDYAINSCYKLPPELAQSKDGGRNETSAVFSSFAPNGMHLSEHGYACAAALVRERLLSIPATLPGVIVDASRKSVDGSSVRIRNAKWNPDDTTLVSFEVQEEALSALPLVVNVTGADEKTQISAVILNASKSENLAHHGQVLDASGKSIPGQSFATAVNPQYDELRHLLQKKNELYFHRWRPQNITYLFGFRKHEQGNNAADIAKFDPFIRELEQQIHELQQPQWRTVTLKSTARGGK